MSLSPFSKFSTIGGIPGKGVHRFRVLDTPMVDYFATIIGAFIISLMTSIPLVLVTIGLFVLGIVSHMLFGVPSREIKYLGLN